ncbi:ABC transporter ATP-binding protein [Kribbella italica]|uniref:ABC-2 type transport system ATP-binding protein n=1 Tax=Kribbella italica TaxID=1540520 RepID=A0A7W9JBI5_9ACTN|nr:ABC transporter ATP-binding protein [Kribbella italica]MBB5838378.1 ABC-2 type transport system ATP-binding protein [Kribbella italica]
MDQSAVITAERLTRRFGGRPGHDAVRGIDLAVRRGELFALLGTNGAGKTSALEVLAGLAQPTSGTVRVLGQDPFRSRRLVRSRIGIMLQSRGFAADLTVAETVSTWAGTLTSPRPVDEVLELVGLLTRRNVRVRQLSGGEQQRLGLALAILGKPEVLFLDEPTAGLDPAARKQTWALISDLLLSGTTVLLTTHQLIEASALADRLAILRHGRIVGLGTPEQLAATRPARITFHLPTAASPPHHPTSTPLPHLPQVVATINDSFVTLETPDLQSTLTEVLAWARDNNLHLHDLTARPASLEEAFLAITGSSEEVAA